MSELLAKWNVKMWQLEEIGHLILSEWFETIQNKTKLEARSEEMEIPIQTVSWTDTTPSAITLDICSLLERFENQNINDQNPILKLRTMHDKCQ